MPLCSHMQKAASFLSDGEHIAGIFKRYTHKLDRIARLACPFDTVLRSSSIDSRTNYQDTVLIV